MTVTIKALSFGRQEAFEWTYETPLKAGRFWRQLCATGRAPDTGQPLYWASYNAPGTKVPARIWRANIVPPA